MLCCFHGQLEINTWLTPKWSKGYDVCCCSQSLSKLINANALISMTETGRNIHVHILLHILLSGVNFSFNDFCEPNNSGLDWSKSVQEKMQMNCHNLTFWGSFGSGMTGAFSACPYLKRFKRLKFWLGCSRLSPENNTTTHILHPVQTTSLNMCTCFLCGKQMQVCQVSLRWNFPPFFNLSPISWKYSPSSASPMALGWLEHCQNTFYISLFLREWVGFFPYFDSSLSCPMVEKLFLDWGCTLWLWLAFIIDTSNVLHVPFFCSLPYLPKSSRAAVRFGVGETDYL